MGHYASEMIHESKEEKRNRNAYWKVREELENIPSGVFTTGELLGEIAEILNSSPRTYEFISGTIKKIKNLILRAKKRQRK